MKRWVKEIWEKKKKKRIAFMVDPISREHIWFNGTKHDLFSVHSVWYVIVFTWYIWFNITSKQRSLFNKHYPIRSWNCRTPRIKVYWQRRVPRRKFCLMNRNIHLPPEKDAENPGLVLLRWKQTMSSWNVF